MANFFDHLLSLHAPTYAVAQIAKRFEPNTVLWAFHTLQPSSWSWHDAFEFYAVCATATLKKTLVCVADHWNYAW